MKAKREVNTAQELLEAILELRDIPGMDWFRASLMDSPLYTNANGFKEVSEVIHEILHNKEKKVAIVVDSDADGFSAATILTLWFRRRGIEVVAYQHPGKRHGYPKIADLVEQLGYKPDYVIVSDAGTSDQDVQREYIQEGIISCILDHHEPSVELDELLVPTINYFAYKQPQPCENPDLSGSSIVFKFVQAYDSLEGADYHDGLSAFAALGTIADVMKLNNMSTKGIINDAFMRPTKDLPDFFQVALSQDARLYDTNHITPFVVGWYIAPFINGVIRVGTTEEKNRLLRLMSGADDVATMRAEYDDLFRLKTQQDSQKNTAVENMVIRLRLDGEDEHAVIIAELPDDLPSTMSGLIAGEVASSYVRPALVGRRVKQADGTYQIVGSGRAPGGVGIDNFKDICNDSGLFVFAAGHQSAFGFAFEEKNKKEIVAYLDSRVPEPSATFSPDIAISEKATQEDLDNMFDLINQLKDHWGKGFEECLLSGVLIKNQITYEYIGAKSNVLKIKAPAGLELIKFRVTEEEKKHVAELMESDDFFLVYYGRGSLNEWNGNTTNQIILDDITTKDLSF